METKKIRLFKKDSAFVYAILESLEGMASYSTLDCAKDSAYRELELFYSTDFAQDLEFVLSSMRKKFPIWENTCE